MNNIHIFLFLLFSSGVTVISYKGYAIKNGWRIGRMFYSDISPIKIIGLLSILGSIVTGFFYVKWYLILIGIGGGWLFSGAITALFTRHTQILSLLLLIFSLVFLIISIMISLS